MRTIEKIRYLKRTEINNLQSFINSNYSRNHILSANKRLIHFYYNYKKKNNLSILGYFNNNKLLGIAGIIKQNNWEKKSSKNYFLSLLVKDKSLKKEITFSFFNFIYTKIKPNLFVCSGFNKKIKKVYKKIGKIIKFSHFYIYNDKFKNGLSKNLNKMSIKEKDKINNIKIEETISLSKTPYSKYNPTKSKIYFINKYIKNPFYKYTFLKIKKDGKTIFFFVVRKIKIKNKSKIIRIVDFYGNLDKKIYVGNIIKKYLEVNNFEYIDFLCIGLKKHLLKHIGFNLKKTNQLIPNYFEPFIKKNITLELCIFINNFKDCIFFKGDGDQDRPKLI